MDAMSSRAQRLARGWLVGVFATALAALSHAVAGGGTPSGLALVLGVVFGGMLGTFALSTRPSLPRLVVAIGASQLAFHAAFSTLGEAAPTATTHLHGTVDLVMTTPHAHSDAPYMWLSHALAGLVTLALLRGAETAVWRLLVELVRLVVTAFRSQRAEPVAVQKCRTPRFGSAPARPVHHILSRAVTRRGPPLPVAF